MSTISPGSSQNLQPGQQIIVTNGYVKKQQKVDTGELQRTRTCKKDWEERQL